MKKLFGYIIVLTTTMWGQAVSPTINRLPTRQFGHPASEDLTNLPTQASPNLVEGRELSAPGQIAFDNSVSPPILYIADIGNNRVLAYKNPSGVTPGKTADLVIGQQDMISTVAGGPGSANSTGLSSPTGVAVNSKGDLYIADSGNNRILRFPSPFSATGGPPQPNLVIGQKGFNTGNSPNEGGNCASKTLAFSANGSIFVVSLAIDSKDNLWVTDAINNRVLMFPVANLGQNAVEPVATVVLGQNDFTSNSGPQSPNNTQIYKNSLVQPASLAFDSAGNLYVADSFSRVLYFVGPNFATQGQPAARVLGIAPPTTQGQPATVYPTQYTLGNLTSNGSSSPNGVFTNGTNVFVADTPQGRIIEYDIPSRWAAESIAFPSPPALAVFGQNGFQTGTSNKGQPQPDQFTLSAPYSGAFLGTQMWIADTGNNRVLGFSPTSTGFTGASVLVGQLDYIYNAPNLIEGKEVFLSGNNLHASSMVVDKNSSPPHLYIADPGNNRILCFNDARKVGQGPGLTVADRVIGQTDFKSSVINSPSGLALQPTQTGLHTPVGVAVDNNGNLYVADSGNGRVVRFPAPFNQPAGTIATANLVLGQSSFTSFIQNASSNSMHSPWGIALFSGSDGTPLAGAIAVSDPTYNRVLLFKKQGSGDFTSGQNASLVFGQSSMSTFAAGNGPAALNAPLGIASDTSDRMYVADSNNGRVVVFAFAPQNLSSGPTSNSTIPNLSQPQGVVVSSITTELWVTNTNQNQVLRFPEYNNCLINGCAPTATLVSTAAPLGMTLDGNDNVIVGDTANRITFYFPEAFFRNTANFNMQALTPGMLAVLGRKGSPFQYAIGSPLKDAAVPPTPWPTTLADLNVTVNGIPAPVFEVLSGFGAIYFQVPYAAPTSGFANVIVTQNSTGAILGVGTFQMAVANPGFYTIGNGTGQLAAQNADFSTNGASNPVARGSMIILYLTGAGPVPGAPPDGQSPSGSIPTTGLLVLAINGKQLTSSQISYSGLGAFPGGWQINATVPLEAAQGPQSVVLLYNNIPSNIGGANNPDGSPAPDVKLTGSALTTIYVK